MIRKLLLPVLLVCVLSACAQNSKEAIKEAKSFVYGVYASYHAEGPDLFGHGAGAVFTPSFAKAIAADHSGQQTLNFDPFCACTEPHKTQLAAVSVDLQTPTLAIARVIVLEANGERNRLRLVLLWTEDGWRVDDISTKEIPSLRRAIAQPAQ